MLGSLDQVDVLLTKLRKQCNSIWQPISSRYCLRKISKSPLRVGDACCSGNIPSDIKLIEEDKKVLCQVLNKLHIPDTVDDYKVCSIKLLIDHLRAVSLRLYSAIL